MRLVAVILGAVLTAGAAGGDEPLGSADGRLRLAPGASPDRATLWVAGTAQEIALSPEFHATALHELEGGWLLAGQVEEGNGHSLHLVARSGDRIETLPPPPGRVGLHRVGPAPLTAAGRLVGLAWLEGDGARTLGVRTATWSGSGWLPGPWVSGPGPGSQLALRAALLDDGRWLLVWSAFDGEDDEIVWSLGDGEQFLPPRALAEENRVPDITPALIAVPGGALAAWSRYDGNDYRLRLARFDGEAWRELEWSGGRGSLEAFFQLGGRFPVLVYRTVATDSWDLVELARDGRPRRRATAPASPAGRPVVELTGGRPRLSWDDEAPPAEPEWQQP